MTHHPPRLHPSLPPAAFAGALLAAGVIMIVAGTFYDRIKKLEITGLGTIDLADLAAAKEEAEALAPNDPRKAEQLLRSAVGSKAEFGRRGGSPTVVKPRSERLHTPGPA
jgi:hypothetical protein